MPRVTQSQPQHRESAMRLVGYVRVSTEEQATEGVSLDAQRERLEAYALAHNAELLAIESDEGISGKVSPEKRLGLAAALARIRADEAEGLLVLKLDRLSRTTRHVLDLVDETSPHGWRLVSRHSRRSATRTSGVCSRPRWTSPSAVPPSGCGGSGRSRARSGRR